VIKKSRKRAGDYTAFVCPQLSVVSNLKTGGKAAEARRSKKVRLG